MKKIIRKTALITGSSGGIGSAVARDLASKGYHLILMDINEEGNRKLAHELPSAEIITIYLANREELRAICKAIPQYELDIAFINAGLQRTADLVEISEESIDLQLEINLRSAIILNQVCGKDMKIRNAGHIINTVSAGGVLAIQSSAVYSAAKFGLRGFLMAFHSEMKPYGVHVSGLYPGAVDTPMMRKEVIKETPDMEMMGMPISVEDVVNGFNLALRTGQLEVHLPKSFGLFTKLVGGVIPGSISRLLPILARLSSKGWHKYADRVRKEELQAV